jgi:AcrR family transcriptional regulator
MGSTERRERERHRVREQILEAARELLGSAGYEQVTMRRIAGLIEYSTATLYTHFADKAALMDALCEADLSRLLASLGAVSLLDDPLHRIRELALAYARFGRENAALYRCAFMAPSERDPGHDGLGAVARRAFDLLLAEVENGVRAGVLGAANPLTATQVLWASLHGVVALLVTCPPHHFPGGAPPSHLVEQVVDNVLRGLSFAGNGRRSTIHLVPAAATLPT